MGSQRMVSARGMRSPPRSQRLLASDHEDEAWRSDRDGAQAEPPRRRTPWALVSTRTAPFGPGDGQRGWALAPAAMLGLQRTHGNAHVQRLLTIQRCGATPCNCSPEERAAGAGQQTTRPSAPVMLQRMWPFGEEEEKTSAPASGEDKSWWEEAAGSVSDWASGEPDQATPGPGGAPAKQPAPESGSGGAEKSWWEEAGDAVSDWLAPGDDKAAPGPGKKSGPSAEGAEGQPGPVAEPASEKGGLWDDITDWLSPVAAGGEKAAGAAGEAAGGAWDSFLAEIEKKQKEQVKAKCDVKAGQKFKWCVTDYATSDCTKQAARAPRTSWDEYQACIDAHGPGCLDFAHALGKECYDSNGLEGHPGVILPGEQQP